MIFKRMREHILGKAIRGKLVPQLHEEGYVKQICNAPTNVPFAIPSTWKWCSLGNLVDYGKAEKISCNDIPSSTWVLELEDIEENTGKILEKKRDVEVKSNKNVFEEGYVLYSKLRPYLNKVVIADECGVCTTELIPINVKSAKAPLLPKYLQFFLMSPDFVDYANRHSHGTKPRLGTNDAKAANIPIPPFEEQNRIVAKIESLFGEIDRAEKAYEELQSLANVLRGQILQKAIQGKLVPQQPEDGVVDQIGEAPAEVPFEIPESWKWLKIKEICILQSGKFIKASEICESGTYPCYGANGVRGGVDKYNYDGDYILIGRVGACGNIHIANGKFYVTDNAIVAGFKKELIDQKFLALSLTAMNLKKLASATAQPLITSTKIENLILSLPPLAEQKRIVAKVEALFEQIDLMAK